MNASVLIVDDDAAFRGLAQRLLTAFGLRVAGEADGVASAIVAADALRPDAVLVDVGLPDGDGVTCAQLLTALAWRPKVVLTSTDADAVSAADLRASGAEAFVPKEHLPNADLQRLLGKRAA